MSYENTVYERLHSNRPTKFVNIKNHSQYGSHNSANALFKS